MASVDSASVDPRGEGTPLIKASIQQIPLKPPLELSTSKVDKVSAASLCRSLLHAWNPARNIRTLTYRPSEQLACLDGLRAIALLWVIAFHCHEFIGLRLDNFLVGKLYWPPTKDLLTDSALVFWALSGDMGVDLFFVLSGFLIMHILLREYEQNNGRICLWRFYLRRWMRLCPAYAFALVVNFQQTFWLDHEPHRVCQQWGWANMLFVNNLMGSQGPWEFIESKSSATHIPLLKHACLGHTWSLAVEFQFYLVSPFIVMAMCMKNFKGQAWGGRITVVLIMFSLLLRLYFITNYSTSSSFYAPTDPTLMYNKTWTRCTPYLLGMLAAFKSNRNWSTHWEPATLISNSLDGLALVVCFGLVYFGSGNVGIVWNPPVFNGALVLLSRAVYGATIAYSLWRIMQGSSKRLNRWLSWPGWVPVARLSYSAYLLQFDVIFPLCHFAVSLKNVQNSFEAMLQFLLLLGLTIPILLLLAMIPYLLIERPIMNLRV